jgi:bifunctional UDP-N-acetylglucosamine pyrophosphorylase/glucosamine-1-phosphate N-acetyltransferase
MELRPRCEEKVRLLLQKGVEIPNPLTLDIGDEVRVEQISGRGTRILPGCRIYGEKTVISDGVQIGYESPVTIEDCQIGPRVELKGGFFRESVFLEGAGMGSGAHVREGCILEEQASGAHCVGLKQTILFPFVTLGSLINFCDCLMAGGTGRRDHSEVGSSYIHFNFTPEGDKATPSLIGDVPRGVMLNQPPIFLGGQGGMVGPLRVGFGNVVAAGAILRGDVTEENKLVLGKAHSGGTINYTPYLYAKLSRIVANNTLYLANLVALEEWYTHVRRQFFSGDPFGDLLYGGALQKLSMAKIERVKRLKAMAEKIHLRAERDGKDAPSALAKQEFHQRAGELSDLFLGGVESRGVAASRETFLTAFRNHREGMRGGYLDVVKSLPESAAQMGT